MLNKIASLIMIIGGINWGLVGLFNFNLVSFLFGNGTVLTRIIYIIIGVCSFICIRGLCMSDNCSSSNQNQ